MKRFIPLILLLLLISCDTSDPRPLSLPARKIYLPIVLELPECNYKPRSGVAWLHHPPSDLDILCGGWYYNASSDGTGKGIPILWCNNSTIKQPASYTGFILFLNEPDIQTQCNITPLEGARVFRRFQDKLPSAKFIGPNISQFGISWLQDFIDAYIDEYDVSPQPYRWAFHTYTRLTEIEGFCDMLERNGYECKNIWITEFGSCNPSVMYNMTKEFATNSTRYERFAPFTNRTPANASWPDCLSLIGGNGELTDVGEAYMRAMRE